MKRTKKVLLVMTCFVMAFALAFSAYAVSSWEDFSASLPSNQGDTEVSTIALSDPSVGHMNVILYTMTNGYDSVRAWGEKSSFGHPNVSDPYDVINLQYQGINWNIYYYSSANIGQGDNIILNLDNPINTEFRPIVTGKWTPN